MHEAAKTRASLPLRGGFASAAAFTTLAALLGTLYVHLEPRRVITMAMRREKSALTVLSLAFELQNTSVEHGMLEHNCAMVKRTRHSFVVHTEDISKPYCQTCTCIKFEKTGCKCPEPEKSKNCNLCEKLLFLKKSLEQLGEFVFLDADLVILKKEFLDRLWYLSRAHDFLARKGIAPKEPGYFSHINSGLMFIRRVPGVDYDGLIELLWEMKSNNDQNIISHFVFDQYKNWDTLSMRWHCRYLYRSYVDIPFEECYTLHGRDSAVRLMQLHNMSLQTVDDA